MFVLALAGRGTGQAGGEILDVFDLIFPPDSMFFLVFILPTPRSPAPPPRSTLRWKAFIPIFFVAVGNKLMGDGLSMGR